MRVGPIAQLRTRDADLPEQPQHLVAGLAPVETLVAANGLADLLSSGEERIEKGHRILEDHRDSATAQVFHLPLGQSRQIQVVEENATGDELAGWHGHQLHDRARGNTLPRTGLTDEAEHLATTNLEVD